MKQYEQVTKYKKVFKEASEEEVLKKYKTDAIKSLSELYNQAKTGYGQGNALQHIIEVLKESIPENVIKFLHDKNNWNK